MNLDKLENKEPLIKDFFSWLFDDERIIDKNIFLENEIDSSLVPYYRDSHIYFPKQIANFFNTKAMKRLERISQLGLLIDEFPNAYHNRLEHSKGVYNRKLEEMLLNYQNPLWRKQMENNKNKLYLLAELIKMAGHDIGHLPLSHALEEAIFNCHGPHEVCGKRIMLENSEIQSVLYAISPELPSALKDLYEKHILNFQEHDESNYDVDRFDYLYRDNLYAGSPIFIPYSHYETVSISINRSCIPEQNLDGSILEKNNSTNTIDVYEYNTLSDIEYFLEIREKSYKNMYFSQNVHVRERTINTFFKYFLSSPSSTGEDLRNFVTRLRTSGIDNIDLSLFLEWDDIKFYSEILDIAKNHENPNIRLLATMIFPNMNNFLTMLHYELNLSAKGQNYSKQDKQFLKNIKSIIKGTDTLSQNLKTPSFALNNTLVYPVDQPLPEGYTKLIENGLIYSSKIKIKAYNPKEPIYVRDATGKIYDLANHPDRKCDWHTRISYMENIYTYVPLLKLNGISDEQIEEIRAYCTCSPSSKPKCQSIFMKPSKISKYIIENDFLEL